MDFLGGSSTLKVIDVDFLGGLISIFRIYPGVADMLLELEEGGADREKKDRSGRNQKHLHIMFMILVTWSTGHDFNS